MKRNHSYWEQDQFYNTTDLLIVGAGIVGLSAAMFYKQHHPGKTVRVIDRGTLPAGASTRNAGFACVGSISEHRADLEKESEENVKKRIKRRYDGLQLLRSELGEEAIGYDPCGGYELFVSQERFDEHAVLIERWNEWLVELTGEQEVYSAGTLNGYPVIRNRLEGALHPGMLMRSLINRVVRAGVEIRWGCEARVLGKGGSVHLAGGASLEADQLLIANNGFARELLPDLDTVPARGYVMVSDAIEDLPWKGTFHHDRGYIYFRNIGNRLLLGGARNLAKQEEQTDRFGINPNIKQHLVNFAESTLHISDGWGIDYEWSGIMGFTPSKTPVLKRLDDTVTVAAGLSGMGIAIGMEVGRTAAGLAAARDH